MSRSRDGGCYHGRVGSRASKTTWKQRWKVTEYFYSSTVLSLDFEVLVMLLSISLIFFYFRGSCLVSVTLQNMIIKPVTMQHYE